MQISMAWFLHLAEILPRTVPFGQQWNFGLCLLPLNCYNQCQLHRPALLRANLLCIKGATWQMLSDLCWCVGSIVFAKASSVLLPSDLERKYGSLGPEKWLPRWGNLLCYRAQRPTGHEMQCLECKWHLGGEETKAKEVSLSSTKAILLESASLPRDTPHSTTSKFETQ